MDFAPMSLRMVVPHANDVGEMQHNMNHQSALHQDFKAEQQKRLIEQQQSQVRKKDEAEGEKIKDNPEREGNGKQGASARKKKKSPKEIMEEQEAAEAQKAPPMAMDSFRGRSIDISC